MDNNDVLFMMKLASEVKNIVFERIGEEYKDHDNRIEVLMDFLTNFCCNTISDMSIDGKADKNIHSFIRTIKAWMDKTQHDVKKSVYAEYNPLSGKIKIEEIH